MLVSAERETEAESAFRRGQHFQDPRAPINRNNLGVLLRYRGKDKEAAEVFAGSLRIEPDTIVLRLNLANTLKALGKTSEARGHFEKGGELARKVLLRDPRDAPARTRLRLFKPRTAAGRQHWTTRCRPRRSRLPTTPCSSGQP